MLTKLTLFIAAVLFMLGFAGYALFASGPEGIRIPAYSMTEVATHAATGESTTIQTFVRSDGSMAQTPGNSFKVIWDIPGRTEAVIDPITKTYLLSPLVSRRVPQFMFAEGDCHRYFSRNDKDAIVTCSPAGSRFGHATTEVAVLTRRPDGTSPKEISLAVRDLGWLVVKHEAYDTSGVLLHSREAVSLTEGEPSPSEFAIPSSFRLAANFLEFAEITRMARQRPLAPAEIDQNKAKWANLVKEALAEGDARFK